MRKTFQRRTKSEPMEIDITSLLDILVILLVFLLKSYNASDLKLDLVKNLTVADSKARKLGSQNIIIQVDKLSNIWVDNKRIGRIPASMDEIPSLLSILKSKDLSDKKLKNTKQKSINLVFDKSTPYNSLQKIMHTSTVAGFTQFKFIVQGNY